jgi:hypothetical protein
MKLLINKSMTAENGVAVEQHSITRIELSPDLETLYIDIESYASEDARVTGAGPAWSYRIAATVAGLTLTGGLHAGIVAAVLADATFEGGEETADVSDELATVQARQWAAIKAHRNAIELSPFSYDSHDYDGDAVAQRRIIGAVAAALVERVEWLTTSVKALATHDSVTLGAEPTFSQTWTLADDTTEDLDEAGMFGLGMALLDRTATAFATARDLYDEIMAATTTEDAEAVAWPG